MKRRNLLKHLHATGCELLREGSRHTLYINNAAGKVSTIPRHREINEALVRKICRDLDISEPLDRT